MTRKERFEAGLRQEDVDRVPFWVKIFGPSYRDFHPRYQGLSDLELADLLDLDHMAGGGSHVVPINNRVEDKQERHNGLLVREYRTPDGTLTSTDRFDEGSHSWHPSQFPIKTREDLRAARHLFAGARYEARDDLLANCRARLEAVGDRGITMVGMGISPLMNLIEHFIGPDKTYYFLHDYPDEMEELITLMHEDRVRYLWALLPDCPFDYVVSVENTSTTLLSPAVFERYCWRHLNDYGRLVVEHGKHHVLHMCGHLKALLPRINELPALTIEAYTAPPVGNTTVRDRLDLCPSVSIIGGTSATLWLKPVAEICRAIEESLAEAGTLRGLALTSAGEMPRLVPIEKIQQVRAFARGLTPERFG